jgi:hypothetical protein
MISEQWEKAQLDRLPHTYTHTHTHMIECGEGKMHLRELSVSTIQQWKERGDLHFFQTWHNENMIWKRSLGIGKYLFS